MCDWDVCCVLRAVRCVRLMCVFVFVFVFVFVYIYIYI